MKLENGKLIAETDCSPEPEIMQLGNMYSFAGVR